jgi:alpha,alpha-trehalase
MLNRRFPCALLRLMLLLSLLGTALAQSAAPAPATENPQLKPILEYIHNGWDTLTRSMSNCDSIVDPKVAAPAILYLPAEVPILPAVKLLEQQCNVQVKHLPMVIQRLGQVDTREVQPPGLLFLPQPYVVPGGRFNEMYGWDSYFIIVGLLRAGRVDLARGIVDNFLYEIDHYGALLNANRTYMLTRSQPPFLSSMIMGVYQAEKAAGHGDKDWLTDAYEHAQRDYYLWDHEPHLAGDTGLARYYDFGEGPAQEGL